MTDHNKTLNVIAEDVLHLDNAELISARVNGFIESRDNAWDEIIASIFYANSNK